MPGAGRRRECPIPVTCLYSVTPRAAAGNAVGRCESAVTADYRCGSDTERTVPRSRAARLDGGAPRRTCSAAAAMKPVHVAGAERRQSQTGSRTGLATGVAGTETRASSLRCRGRHRRTGRSGRSRSRRKPDLILLETSAWSLRLRGWCAARCLLEAALQDPVHEDPRRSWICVVGFEGCRQGRSPRPRHRTAAAGNPAYIGVKVALWSCLRWTGCAGIASYGL